MSKGDGSRSLSSLVLVRKGSPIPAVPSELAGFVRVERVEGMNTHEVPVQHYDEWLVTNAKAGFTGRGSLRLRDKKGRVSTWISGIDMQNIIGIDGSGTLKRNHRICFECGHRAIYHGEFHDTTRCCKVVIFKCTHCDAVKRFPKRPNSRKSLRQAEPKLINNPPKFIRGRLSERLLPKQNQN